MNHKISIITPTYNHENYIRQCIDSVLAQTYKNWEMIIIDDYSTDFTYAIEKKYAAKDKRIKVFKHSRRWGVEKLCDTYNQALKKSKGDLIAILEGDDFWPSYKLEEQVRDFEDSKIILSHGDCVITDSNGRPFQIRNQIAQKNINWLNNNPVGSILYAFSDLNFFLEPSTIVVRRKSLMGMGGFKSNRLYPISIDIPTWLELALRGKFSYNHRILGYYRRHSGSAWFNFAKKTNSMGRKEMHNFFLDFVKKNKKTIESLGVVLNEKQLITQHKAFIDRKIKRKNLSLLLHNIVFNDKRSIINASLRILKGKHNLLIKVAALASLILLPFLPALINLNFRFRFLLYII